MRTVTIRTTETGDIELSQCGEGFILEETNDSTCQHRLSRKYDTALAALQDLESDDYEMWGMWSDYFDSNGEPSDKTEAA